MKTWAAGLNYRLLQNQGTRGRLSLLRCTIKTKYHPDISSDLNGIDFTRFKALVREVGFQPRVLKMPPIVHDMKNARRKWLRLIYMSLYRIPALQEFLSYTIVLHGTKPV
ncbi:MAG: hypothetical protein U0694_24470 [Anaerolineae bacterium]